jgi:hypothetical protein
MISKLVHISYFFGQEGAKNLKSSEKFTVFML